MKKNINKYTVAVDENDKVVLIDRNGKTSDVNADIDITDAIFNYGRVLSLYQNKSYLKVDKSEKDTIYDLDDKIITEEGFFIGFYNGYCFISDSPFMSDNKSCKLIDFNGKVIYTKTSDIGFAVYPVDQNGLFTIAYYSGNDVVKSEIVDLNGTVIYSSDNDYEIEALGNGFFRQHNAKGYAVYKVTAEWGEIYGKNKKKSCIKSDRRYFDRGRSDNIYCIGCSALWCAVHKNPLGRGIYAGLSGKNKCDKLDTVLHIYGSCGGNGYCRHCYGVHKAKK